ncbi:MAG: hypothetical protein ACLFUG_04705 [Nitriliruptoraceae bacterium]
MRPLGYVLFYGAGLILFALEVYWFTVWWGGLGLFIGLFVAPIAALFPFIYLFMEGFSLLYFGLWAVGIVGAAIASQD